MFNIDRRYIDAPQFEETLQSKIITVRSKYRNDPTLPHADHFGVSDEEFEEYIDRKQDLLEWQKDMKRRGPLWLENKICVLHSKKHAFAGSIHPVWLRPAEHRIL